MDEVELLEPVQGGGGDPRSLTVSIGKSPTTPEPVDAAHYKIGRKLSRALNEIVHGARTVTEAAERSGMSREGLSKALGKGHVVAELERRVRTEQVVRGAKSMHKLSHLMDAARSEYVQLEAAKATADRSGYAVNKREHDAVGGLVINIDLG